MKFWGQFGSFFSSRTENWAIFEEGFSLRKEDIIVCTQFLRGDNCCDDLFQNAAGDTDDTADTADTDDTADTADTDDTDDTADN